MTRKELLKDGTSQARNEFDTFNRSLFASGVYIEV